MVRLFVRLKLRLIRNGLRLPQYAILFSIGTIGSGVLAFAGFTLMSGLRGDALAPDAAIAFFGSITLVWTVVPLLGFGTDETLDPQRLALLPLRRSQLLAGLLAASLVGIAPIAAAFAMLGALVALAHGVLAAVLIVLAILGTIVLCVVASRTLIALLAPLLRSRRGRDLLLMTLLLAGFVPQTLRLLAARGHSHDVRRIVAQLADRLRVTPFGLGGLAVSEAGRNHIGAAVGVLLLLAALIAVLLWLWSVVIPRAMTTSDISAPERERAHRSALFPRWLPFLPRTRVGAVAAKELRYYFRDPRRRAPVFAALIVPTLFLFTTLRNAPSRPSGSTMLALLALLPASGLTLNQFGLDGAALWSNIVAGDDARGDLIGKNIATSIIVLPLVAVPAMLTAAVTHGWAYVPITILLVPGALGVFLGVGNFVSVWVPYALPDRRNPLAANPGQGCVGGMAAIGALLVDAIILTPAGVLVAGLLFAFPLLVATPVAVATVSLYGLAVWRGGLHLASRRVSWRMPELLDAVSPRQAG